MLKNDGLFPSLYPVRACNLFREKGNRLVTLDVHMKKALLSLCVVVAFVVYTIMFRHQATKLVLKPVTLSTTHSASTSNSSTSTTGSSTSSNSGSSITPSSHSSSTSFHNGTYIGSIADAFYGNVQVEATVKGESVTSVKFLQSPNDNPNSININSQAMPLLEQEALRAQSANVNIISGASDTSQAFIQSLSNALSQAK